MNPIYECSYFGMWIKVYPNRVEFFSPGGVQNVPINQIAGIELGMMGYMQITIETAGGKKYKIPCNKKQEVKEAIYNAQEQWQKSQNSTATSTNIADELTKLLKLKKQGILSEKEFEGQKKKLLD